MLTPGGRGRSSTPWTRPRPSTAWPATALYADLAPRLHFVHADVVTHLRANPGAYDVLYSHFGAVDFTDPHELLPAAADALRPGGRLVFSTLAHYLSGKPAQPDVTAAEVPAKTPEGESATMYRWVLQEHVWIKVLDQAGFTGIRVEELPAGDGPRPAAPLLVTPSAPPPETGPGNAAAPGRVALRGEGTAGSTPYHYSASRGPESPHADAVPANGPTLAGSRWPRASRPTECVTGCGEVRAARDTRISDRRGEIRA